MHCSKQWTIIHSYTEKCIFPIKRKGRKYGDETCGYDPNHLEAGEAAKCTLNIDRIKCLQALHLYTLFVHSFRRILMRQTPFIMAFLQKWPQRGFLIDSTELSLMFYIETSYFIRMQWGFFKYQGSVALKMIKGYSSFYHVYKELI